MHSLGLEFHFLAVFLCRPCCLRCINCRLNQSETCASRLVQLGLHNEYPVLRFSLCNLCVLCVLCGVFCSEFISHRDTENTEVAQSLILVVVQSWPNSRLAIVWSSRAVVK